MLDDWELWIGMAGDTAWCNWSNEKDRRNIGNGVRHEQDKGLLTRLALTGRADAQWLIREME